MRPADAAAPDPTAPGRTPSARTAPERVVIVGGGFAGLYAARELRKGGDRVAVTLVDRRNHHLFQPLLYQVATGALSPGEIAQPLRSIFRKQSNVTVLLGEATGIDPERREVCLSDGGRLPYDTLIVATGARHSYFGHEDWAPFAPGLKTIDDATEIRRRILIAFEAAERETDPQARREWMTFVIVGGGPTGVELAGALGEIANDTLRNDFRSIRPADAWIEVLEANDRILATYPPDRSASAQHQLERLGVIVRTSCRVVHIEDGLVRYEGPSGSVEVRARTILWAAGVQAASFGRAVAEAVGASTDRSGRNLVERDLTVPGHPEILVAGDAAIQPWTKGRVVPGVAQGGIQGGKHAARVVLARLDGEPAPAVPVPGPRGRRGHRPAAGRHQHRLARAVREAERVPGLGAVARDPHRVPDRVREPDRRLGALGVVVPDEGAEHAADHRVAADPADRAPGAARRRRRTDRRSAAVPRCRHRYCTAPQATSIRRTVSRPKCAHRCALPVAPRRAPSPQPRPVEVASHVGRLSRPRVPVAPCSPPPSAPGLRPSPPRVGRLGQRPCSIGLVRLGRCRDRRGQRIQPAGGLAIDAASTSGNAVRALSTSGVGVFVSSSTSNGVDASSEHGFGAKGLSNSELAMACGVAALPRSASMARPSPATAILGHASGDDRRAGRARTASASPATATASAASTASPRPGSRSTATTRPAGPRSSATARTAPGSGALHGGTPRP